MYNQAFESQEWLGWYRWGIVNNWWRKDWPWYHRQKVEAAEAEALAFTFTHDLLTYDS